MSRTPSDQQAEDLASQDGSDAQESAGGGDNADNDLTRLQAERNDLYNKLARAQAEFQNARKRLESDKEQSVQFANSSLIKSLLPVIDNFERAIAQDPAKIDVGSLIKGMQIVHDQWLAVLAQQSVAPIAVTMSRLDRRMSALCDRTTPTNSTKKSRSRTELTPPDPTSKFRPILASGCGSAARTSRKRHNCGSDNPAPSAPTRSRWRRVSVTAGRGMD